jgi:hypothetical protein
MDKFKSKTIQNNKKLKIKTISDLHLLNLDKKKYPSFRINSNPKIRQFSFQKLKLQFEEMRNSSSVNKKKVKEKEKGKNKIEDIIKENIELKKKIEFLEKENKKLKKDKHTNNNSDYILNTSIKSDKLSSPKNKNNNNLTHNKYKSYYNNYSLKFNNSLINAASKYFINLKKATLYNDFKNSIQSEQGYNSINTESSPKLLSNRNKLIKYCSNNNSNRYSKNTYTSNSIDNDIDTKDKLNNIKKRTNNLFEKYVHYLGINKGNYGKEGKK